MDACYERIGQKVSYRLAQRPGSYVILKYVRPVVKRRDTQAISTAPAPQGVIADNRADVSLLAGLLRDTFDDHRPLYRQHRRLVDSGIEVSCAWLTPLSQQSIALLGADLRRAVRFDPGPLREDHGLDPDQGRAQRYRLQPYAVAADGYAAGAHPGRGGWNWYTYTIGWMYRLLCESMLGLRREGARLHIVLRVPDDWTRWTVEWHRAVPH